ncbi:MAG: hypothetical protein RLO80_08865 [Hyphomonas sp.]
MKTAIFTICSRNYLAYALTLQKSLQAHEPGRPFFIYLADAPLDPGTEPDATIIPVQDLKLPDMLDMAFRYTVMEFNTAIKADCFLDLLTKRGFDAAIYLDPDIQVFAPLAEVHGALSSGASVVLTPHLLEPLPPDAYPSELDILKSGVFNLGFGAFSCTQESLAFIRWWAEKLHKQCYSAPEQGLFVDQRFVDMAPAFIERFFVLRNPGYNVAYWNMATRNVSKTDSGVTVNGAPLIFFHFSGVVAGKPAVFSKHLGGRQSNATEPALVLVSDYLDQLKAQDHDRWSNIPYAFDRFRDGSFIIPPMRRLPPTYGSAEDWFAAPDVKFWTAPDPRIDQNWAMKITRLMMEIWQARPDLQAAFPLSKSSGRRALYVWFRRHGVKEYGKIVARKSAL